MRLSHQMFVGSALVFLIVLAAIFGTYVATSRTYLEKQLASHAQDAATSLAVALTSSLRDNDMSLAETTISAVFSRGYYRHIVLLDQRGAALIEKRQGPVDALRQPGWMQTLLPFEAPRRSALVIAGWRQLGQIEVESSPEFAYQQLRNFSVTAAIWLIVAFATALFLLSLLMRRILEPLHRIEIAAREIEQRQFRPISPVPRTLELRNVVEGFNRLSSTIEHLLDDEERRAERFRRLAYTDQVVGLPNRSSLMSHLDVLSGEMNTDVAVALVDIDGLRTYNAMHGYSEGDEMIRSMARIVTDVADGNTGDNAGSKAFCARLQGACFAVVLPGCNEASAHDFGNRLRQRLSESIHNQWASVEMDFAIGICSCPVISTASDLLAVADTALAAARHLGLGAVVVDWQSTLPDVASQAWQKRIHRALDKHRFVLVGQAVYGLSPDDDSSAPDFLHTEVFARMTLDDGEELSAAQFIPMAARHGLLEAIDRACLELLFSALISGSQTGGIYSFNLSADALRRPAFTQWLLAQLERLGSRASSIIIEVTEFAAQSVAKELLEFSSKARGLGAKLIIDQFGLTAGGFHVLRLLLPDSVKLAGSLLHDIQEDDEKRFYLESVCSIANSLRVPVIATCVEQTQQLTILRSLGVSAVQGNVLATVQPLFR